MDFSQFNKAGFHADLDIDLYHHPECPGVSNSGLSLVLNETLADYQEYKRSKPEPKDWGNYGNAVHTAILQPQLFQDKYTHLPEFFGTGESRRPSNFALKEGKDKKAFAEAEGKICLRFEEYQAILKSVENVKAHKYANKFLLEGEGIVEGSCFWRDEKTGVLCKTRPDRLLPEIVVEIKTTEDPSPKEFARSVFKYGYHRQGAFQLDGVRACLRTNPKFFVIVAIGKKAPYHVVTHVIQAQAIERGRAEYQYALTHIKQAQETNVWPGFEEKLHELDLPEWAYALTFGN